MVPFQSCDRVAAAIAAAASLQGPDAIAARASNLVQAELFRAQALGASWPLEVTVPLERGEQPACRTYLRQHFAELRQALYTKGYRCEQDFVPVEPLFVAVDQLFSNHDAPPAQPRLVLRLTAAGPLLGHIPAEEVTRGLSIAA